MLLMPFTLMYFDKLLDGTVIRSLYVSRKVAGRQFTQTVVIG
jgi:hypothetical protein